MSATSVNSACAESAGGQGRRADPQAGGDHRRARIERNGVAVDRDADPVQPVLALLAVQLGVAQVHQHQVHVGASGHHRDPGGSNVVLQQPLGQDLGAFQGALLALLEGIGPRRS